MKLFVRLLQIALVSFLAPTHNSFAGTGVDGKFILCDESQYDPPVGYEFRQGRWVTYSLRTAASAESYNTGVYETDFPDRKYRATDRQILFNEPDILNYNRINSVYVLDRITLVREKGSRFGEKDPVQCRLLSKASMVEELEIIWRARVDAKRKADKELESRRQL